MAGKHSAKHRLKTDKTILKTNNKKFVKKRKGRLISYLFGLIGLLIIVGFIAGSFVAFQGNGSTGNNKAATATINIPKGFSSTDIAERLAEEGIIKNAFTFRIYASLNNIDGRFLPGDYTLNSEMTFDEIADKLTSGPKRETVTVVIPEGYTIDQVNQRLADVFKRDKSEFEAVTKGSAINDYELTTLPAGAKDLEGYLFPKTYTFEKNDDPKKVVKKLLSQYELETKSLDWSSAEQRGLSKKDIVIIASLIEKEAKVPEERPLMAAVIYNRIELGMPLQIDATIQYVLPERKEVLTIEDTKYDSPYNTYQKQGLPPGPIANPGVDSMKAALAPAQVDYLYYVLTSPDGSHTFTSNYDEFLEAKKQMN